MPKPKFKIGQEVRISDIGRVGVVSHVGEFDSHLGQYRYKVRDSDGDRKTWNENSLTKVKVVTKAEAKKNMQWQFVMRAADHLTRLVKEEKFPSHETAEAHELELWQENDSRLVNQQTSIEVNLVKKIIAGKFDYASSVRLWQYLADSAAQSYTRMHGSGHGSSYGIFTTKVRNNLARRLAHDFASRFANYILFGTEDLLSPARALIEKVKAK